MNTGRVIKTAIMCLIAFLLGMLSFASIDAYFREHSTYMKPGEVLENPRFEVSADPEFVIFDKFTAYKVVDKSTETVYLCVTDGDAISITPLIGTNGVPIREVSQS